MNGVHVVEILAILALNFGISWMNAAACGKVWVEAKALGGYIKVLVWCGAIQSAIGFSSVFLFPLMLAARALRPDIFTDEMMSNAADLWYVTIIFPALGTGIVIMIESWIVAYHDRSFGNIGRAAYNTFAQAHNTMSAITDFGKASQAVGKMFTGRGDARGKAALLAIIVVTLALCAGIILTAVLIHRYAGTVPLPPAEARADKKEE